VHLRTLRALCLRVSAMAPRLGKDGVGGSKALWEAGGSLFGGRSRASIVGPRPYTPVHSSRPPQRPIVIRTLGDFLAYPGHRLTAHCPACQHSEPLDVRRLVDRYGGDTLPAELEPFLRCWLCDHKGGEILTAHIGLTPG